jgi:hypothetical protein
VWGTQFEVRGGGGAHRGWAVRGGALRPQGGMPVRESSGGCGGRLEVQEGVWGQWEAHRLRGGLERWLVEAVVDEVAVEEVAGSVGGGLALRADTKEEAVL